MRLSRRSATHLSYAHGRAKKPRKQIINSLLFCCLVLVVSSCFFWVFHFDCQIRMNDCCLKGASGRAWEYQRAIPDSELDHHEERKSLQNASKIFSKPSSRISAWWITLYKVKRPRASPELPSIMSSSKDGAQSITVLRTKPVGLLRPIALGKYKQTGKCSCWRSWLDASD